MTKKEKDLNHKNILYDKLNHTEINDKNNLAHTTGKNLNNSRLNYINEIIKEKDLNKETDLENFINSQNSKKSKSKSKHKKVLPLNYEINNHNLIDLPEYNEEEENLKKFINLNKSIDNEIMKEQIKKDLHTKLNKSIINALNKSEAEIHFDNSQLNSSVIDLVLSRIEEKNKNKHKNKDIIGK